MATLSNDARFSRSKDCSWSSLGTEVLILDMVRRRSHRLTGAAAVIWNGAVEGLTLGEVVAKVCSVFDVDQATAEADTRKTLEELVLVKVLILE